MSNAIKSAGQSFLKSLGLYQRVKSSFAYDLYWRLADPDLLAARDHELAFFRQTLEGLPPGGLIFDIGANQGHKTGIFLRLGARVVAVDPDESNQEALRQHYLDYRIEKKAVTIVGKAVSDHSGTDTFWVDQPGSAKNTLSRKWVETLQTDGERFGERLGFGSKVEVETVTLEALIGSYGRPHYIKVDVEGHEPSVLRGLKTAVPFISFEVNLPEFRDEAVECVELLHALSAASRFNYTTDCSGEMALPAWLARDGFLREFAQCHEPSPEIFCRTLP